MTTRFDVTWGGVLWAAGTAIVLCALVMFGLDRPGWIIPAAFVAGGVAGLQSGHYEPAATNAAVGIVLSLPALVALMMLYFDLGTPEPITAGGDMLFMAVIISVSNALVYGLTMVLVAYLGAIVTDYVKRRVNLGTTNTERSNRHEKM